MSCKSQSSKLNNTTSSNYTSNNILPKLRRLKIEENLLLQNLQKLDRKKCNEMAKVLELETSHDLEYKKILKHIKDSFLHVNTLFDDLKTITCSQEILAELELSEVKKKVHELESTLKSLKGFINVELNSLKVAEQKLIDQIQVDHKDSANIEPIKTSAKYHHVVLSPVRLLMTSPFKCTEVQEFQDFMKNSLNRYGGWNEYHHNLFVKYWHKHFGNSIDKDFNDPLAETLALENFIEETLFKLQGVERESLIEHIDWYKKYLFYKDRQQKAIDKWKSNRRSISKVSQNIDKVLKNSEHKTHTSQHCVDDIKDFNSHLASTNIFTREQIRCSDVYYGRKSQCLDIKRNSYKPTKSCRKIIRQDDIERFMKPTKQWLYRNHDDDHTHSQQQMHFIESMEKLRIPTWRQYLNDII